MERGQAAAVVCALALSTWLGGCAPEGERLESADVLELRLGGRFESLADRLRRPPPGFAPLHVTEPEPEPQPHSPPLPPPSITPITDDPPVSTPPVSIPEKPPQPVASPTPPPRPQFREVELRPGQTLYGLCRTELGDGGRWKEIARLNGWSEARVSRLPAGQKVKLPVR